MSPKQHLFAEQYVLDHNGAAAAVRAGYAANSSRVTASQLLAKPNVRALVAEHEQAAAERLGVSRERVIVELEAAIDLARTQGDPAAMIRGWAEIARMCGLYATDRGVKVHLSVAAKRTIADVETLTDAELTALVTESGGGSPD